MFEVILRWAWGTLLTAIVMAVLTMLLRHGRRWFRGVRRFIRTGRAGTARRSLDGRGRAIAHTAPSVREPRMTTARVLTALAQLDGARPSSASRQNNATVQNNDVPLDLKF